MNTIYLINYNFNNDFTKRYYFKTNEIIIGIRALIVKQNNITIVNR